MKRKLTDSTRFAWKDKEFVRILETIFSGNKRISEKEMWRN